MDTVTTPRTQSPPRPRAIVDTASAAAKVILLGEHAVVHGRPALAAGLPDGLRLRAQDLESPTDTARLTIPAWELDLSLDAASQHPVTRAALAVLAHCDGPVRGVHIHGTAAIPARAGLGSSAALCVALARLVLGHEAPRAHLLDAANEGERVFHGAPSGIDAHVACSGGLVRFMPGQDATPILASTPLDLVIVPTGVARQTAEQVARVRARLQRHPTVVAPVLDALGAATDAGIRAVESGNLATLGELMNIAGHALEALGVGHPALREACDLARSSGALGAKLTGAGAGGCAIALVPPDGVDAVEARLRDRGWSAFHARISS